MDSVLLRFIRLLRHQGLRISPAETLDGLASLALVPLGDRRQVKTALRATLVKEGRDAEIFDRLFDLFFSVGQERIDGHDGHDHEHGQPMTEAHPSSVKVSEEATDFDDPSHSHETPSDVARYFEDRDLATSRRLHQDGNRIDLSALGQDLMMAADRDGLERALAGLRQQLAVDRLSNAAFAGDLAAAGAETLEADLVVAAADHLPDAFAELGLDSEALEQMRRMVDGGIANLPELLRRHLEKLLLLEADGGNDRPLQPAYRTAFTEEERRRMAAVLRRLAHQFHGALSPRRALSPRGRVHAARTIRSNMRYGGLPFKPVLMSRREDRPRIVLLVDVSLSVRNTARFTLHLVHGLQGLFSQVRTFAFVSELVEVTPYLEDCPLEDALGLIFGGEVLDVAANSNYGAALARFCDHHLGAVNRRTTVVVLGDGRGNGNPANAWALDAVRRRCRQLVWLTPEHPRSWVLGGSDMPAYAEICSRVEVVRDLDDLEGAAETILRGS
ncbi:MAG: VWA domain-containing protein [Actinomycetota bacterium]